MSPSSTYNPITDQGIKHGDFVSCVLQASNKEYKINNARICFENNCAFLCQNDICGADCREKFGFKYSWGLGLINKFINGEQGIMDLKKTIFDKKDNKKESKKVYPTYAVECELKVRTFVLIDSVNEDLAEETAQKLLSNFKLENLDVKESNVLEITNFNPQNRKDYKFQIGDIISIKHSLPNDFDTTRAVIREHYTIKQERKSVKVYDVRILQENHIYYKQTANITEDFITFIENPVQKRKVITDKFTCESIMRNSSTIYDFDSTDNFNDLDNFDDCSGDDDCGDCRESRGYCRDGDCGDCDDCNN